MPASWLPHPTSPSRYVAHWVRTLLHRWASAIAWRLLQLCRLLKLLLWMLVLLLRLHVLALRHARLLLKCMRLLHVVVLVLCMLLRLHVRLRLHRRSLWMHCAVLMLLLQRPRSLRRRHLPHKVKDLRRTLPNSSG